MIAVRAGGALPAVKAHQDPRCAIGEPVRIAVAPAACHLFRATSGPRIGRGPP